MPLIVARWKRGGKIFLPANLLFQAPFKRIFYVNGRLREDDRRDMESDRRIRLVASSMIFLTLRHNIIQNTMAS